MADVRVLVIDDHPVTAQGTAEILGREPGISSVGYALDLAAGVRLIAELSPDVVVCDVMLGDRPAGFDLADRISRAALPPTTILFFSYFANRVINERAKSVGAAGVVDKSISAEALRDTILSIASGGGIPPAAIPRLGQSTSEAPREPSPRELQIMLLIADGASDAQVAHELGIGDRTVETHLDRMFKRYKATTRTQLLLLAERRGWLIPPSYTS